MSKCLQVYLILPQAACSVGKLLLPKNALIQNIYLNPCQPCWDLLAIAFSNTKAESTDNAAVRAMKELFFKHPVFQKELLTCFSFQQCCMGRSYLLPFPDTKPIWRKREMDDSNTMGSCWMAWTFLWIEFDLKSNFVAQHFALWKDTSCGINW